MTTSIRGDVKDISLAARGKDRVDWAAKFMQVIRLFRLGFANHLPLKGYACPAACISLPRRQTWLLP